MTDHTWRTNGIITFYGSCLCHLQCHACADPKRTLTSRKIFIVKNLVRNFPVVFDVKFLHTVRKPKVSRDLLTRGTDMSQLSAVTFLTPSLCFVTNFSVEYCAKAFDWTSTDAASNLPACWPTFSASSTFLVYFPVTEWHLAWISIGHRKPSWSRCHT